MNTSSLSMVMARVSAFLNTCGAPKEPIVRAWRYDDEGRHIPRSGVSLFAPDVRALHDAVSVLIEELRAQWEAAHYDHCGPLVDEVCPKAGQAPPNDCQWPLPPVTTHIPTAEIPTDVQHGKA